MRDLEGTALIAFFKDSNMGTGMANSFLERGIKVNYVIIHLDQNIAA